MRIEKIVSDERMPETYWIVFEDGSRKLATKNLIPGRRVYGEKLIFYNGEEYRIWDPYRSKLAAAIFKDIRFIPIRKGVDILYLGSATGTTVSHISDIIKETGNIFCVEFSPRVMREFVERLLPYRRNLIPILADARFPESYRFFVNKVDIIYADIAQPFQSKIIVDNANVYLKRGGWIMQAIKAMSIDVTEKPSVTYRREIDYLEKNGFKIREVVHLEPYDKAHAFVVAQLIKKE
ncbi:MAG TPA: fibrillarin-like rRNA/tRNA 2'-O-methyltransferase [Thermoprotei archaeon]|nr:fibrillarin-like rRNA/tRNA 2'-O-methyltransferase [Thermoprotei archaeon]